MSMTAEQTAQTASEANAASEARLDAAASAVLGAAENGKVTDDKIPALRNATKKAETETKAAEPTKDEKKPAAEAKDDKPKPGPKAGEKAAAEQRGKEAQARHALRRDGWKDEEIDGLDPAALITVGLKTKARQDSDPNRNGTAASRSAQSTDLDGSSNREGEGENRRPPGPRDADKSAALGPEQGVPESEELARVYDTLDDDSRAILEKAVTADLTAAERVVREARKEAAKAKTEMFEMRQEVVRTDLRREFPQLADDKRFNEVAEWADDKLEPKANWPSMSRESFKAMLSDASAAVFGREAINAARAEHTQALSDGLAGSPRVGGTKASDVATRASKEDIAADAVLKNPGDPEAQRRYMANAMGV